MLAARTIYTKNDGAQLKLTVALLQPPNRKSNYTNQSNAFSLTLWWLQTYFGMEQLRIEFFIILFFA